MNNTTKHFILIMILMISFSLAISILLHMFLPFYFAIPLMIGIFITINFFVRRKLFNKLTSSSNGSRYGYEGSKIIWLCISCGMKHNYMSCPKCGSKGRKATYG